MTTINLPNVELLRMVEKMAAEINRMKEELRLNEQGRVALEFALLIARDEAAVNARLLAEKSPQFRIVNGEDCPVYQLPFAVDVESDDKHFSQFGGAK